MNTVKLINVFVKIIFCCTNSSLLKSNSDLVLSGSGTGSVAIAGIDLNQGTVDNTVIGATTPAAGTFTTLTFNPVAGGTLSTSGVTITDNDITSSLSNDHFPSFLI